MNTNPNHSSQLEAAAGTPDAGSRALAREPQSPDRSAAGEARNGASDSRVSGRRVGTSYRPHDWLDTKTNLPKHGIQAKAVGFECRWLHCAENNAPLLFDTPEERDAKLRELRREEVAKRRDSKPSNANWLSRLPMESSDRSRANDARLQANRERGTCSLR